MSRPSRLGSAITGLAALHELGDGVMVVRADDDVFVQVLLLAVDGMDIGGRRDTLKDGVQVWRRGRRERVVGGEEPEVREQEGNVAEEEDGRGAVQS